MDEDYGTFDDLTGLSDLFDLDGDGELSSIEKAHILDEIAREDYFDEHGHYEEDEDASVNSLYDDEDDSEDEFGEDENDVESEDGGTDEDADVSDTSLSDSGIGSERKHEPQKHLSRRLQIISDVINGNNFFPEDAETIKRCKYLISHQEQKGMRYVNAEGRILYGQCANNILKLPFKFQKEDAEQKMLFGEVFHRIARHGIHRALKFWRWCFENYMPYREYLDEFEAECLTNITSCLNVFKENAYREFSFFIAEDIELRDAWIQSITSIPSDIECLIKEMLEIGKYEVAKRIVEKIFTLSDVDYSDVEFLVCVLIRKCADYNDLTAIYGFLEHLVPVIESLGDEPMKSQIPIWVADIKEHIDYIESSNPRYAYSGKNAWRMKYKDNEFSIDPTKFDCEDDYLDEVERQKNGWKSKYLSSNNFGVDINAYETEDVFISALNDARRAFYKRQDEEKAALREEILKDKTVYTYYGVLFPSATHPYHYFAHETFKLGDKVIVPTGDGGNEMKGIIVSIEQHLRISAPFPTEKTKFIKRIASEE